LDAVNSSLLQATTGHFLAVDQMLDEDQKLNRVISTETNSILSRLWPIILTIMSPQDVVKPFKNMINPPLPFLDLVSSTAT
jgi:hypothetical protein